MGCLLTTIIDLIFLRHRRPNLEQNFVKSRVSYDIGLNTASESYIRRRFPYRRPFQEVPRLLVIHCTQNVMADEQKKHPRWGLRHAANMEPFGYRRLEGNTPTAEEQKKVVHHWRQSDKKEEASFRYCEGGRECEEFLMSGNPVCRLSRPKNHRLT